jgi:hypothetical protein
MSEKEAMTLLISEQYQNVREAIRNSIAILDKELPMEKLYEDPEYYELYKLYADLNNVEWLLCV